jgi:outer membrane receptor protein involved in Fe transport
METQSRLSTGLFKILARWGILILMQGLLILPGHAEEAEEKKKDSQEAVQQKVEKEEAKKAVKLEDITVMATQPGVEITPEKTIVRMDEFVKPGDVRTLTDVLKTMGGIDVMRINPMMASPGDEVSIRGMNEGRLVVEIDGRRINHSGYYGRYIVDWSTLNLDDIERIEIIRGGHSVLHPFAIGGVINIITKKGKKTSDPKPTVNAKAGVGSFTTATESLSIDGGALDFVGYNFSVNNGHTNGYLRNNYQDNLTLNGHLSFYLPLDATLELGIKHANVKYGFPVVNDPSRSDYDPSSPNFYANADQLRHLNFPQYAAYDPHWKKHTTYLDGIFKMPVGPGTVKIHGYQTNGRRWTSLYEKSGKFASDVFADDRTEGVIAEYRDIKLFGFNKVTVGYEYQHLGAPYDQPDLFEVNSAYLQDVISIGDQWRITPGVRYYHVDMNTYYSQYGEGWPVTGNKETDDGFYPSLKVDFQAAEQTALYAAVSRSYRLPCP